MDLVIREAAIDDAEGLGAAHVAAWQAAYPGLLGAADHDDDFPGLVGAGNLESPFDRPRKPKSSHVTPGDS